MLLRLATAFAMVATVVHPGAAFMVSRPTRSSSETMVRSPPSPAWLHPSAPTQLSMGIMEDFLSGADDSARSKANAAYIGQLQKRVDRVNGLEPEIEELGDEDLEAKTAEFRQRLVGGEDINGPLLEEAFAVVREAAWYVQRKQCDRALVYCSFSHSVTPGVSSNCAIMTSKSWVDSFSMTVAWPKWPRAKAKPWWPLCRPMSTP